MSGIASELEWGMENEIREGMVECFSDIAGAVVSVHRLDFSNGYSVRVSLPTKDGFVGVEEFVSDRFLDNCGRDEWIRLASDLIRRRLMGD